MGASTIGSAGVRGMLRRALEQDTGVPWLQALTGPEIQSDSPIETYPFLGQVPAMREWVGGRQAKEFRENSIVVANRHFEATIPVLLRELNRDKTGMLRMRIAELAQRSSSHWASLVSTFILAGETALCYDGQAFFDTDHSEGDSGTQSNDISVDISALPVAVNGTTTAPSPGEAQQAILQAIHAIVGFKDDQGEPMNENATDFLVMTGSGLAPAVYAGLTMDRMSDSSTFDFGGFRVTQATNVRLNASTTKIYVFRTDSMSKALYRQQEGTVMIKSKAENSDYEFDNDAHEYGVDSWREAFYGYWQHACLATLA